MKFFQFSRFHAGLEAASTTLWAFSASPSSGTRVTSGKSLLSESLPKDIGDIRWWWWRFALTKLRPRQRHDCHDCVDDDYGGRHHHQGGCHHHQGGCHHHQGCPHQHQAFLEPKCIFPKCNYVYCILAKCTQLVCLISIVSLFTSLVCVCGCSAFSNIDWNQQFSVLSASSLTLYARGYFDWV